MQSKKIANLLFITWVLIVVPVFAEMVAEQVVDNSFTSTVNRLPQEDLSINLVEPYVVEVLVLDDSGKAQNRAFVKALNLVLEKEIGVDGSYVQQALAKPERYIKQFSYIKRDTKSGERVLFLRVVFDSQVISKLKQHRSKVVWVGNKPTVLLWLASNNGGGRIFTDDDYKISDIVKKKSRELGIQVILPILDLEDIKRIKVDDICDFNTDAVKAASDRYGVSVTAMGCVKPILGKIWPSYWLLSQDDMDRKFYFLGKNIENVITQALQAIANNVVSVIKPIVAENVKVVIRIVDVNGIDQYNKVERYLRTFNGITHVELDKINATNIELAVNVAGGKQALLEILSKQKRLVLNPDVEVSLPGIDLDCKWVR